LANQFGLQLKPDFKRDGHLRHLLRFDNYLRVSAILSQENSTT
jgi:hypothetical protein